MNPMTIYLAGPMTGYPKFNFPAFASAAKALRATGHEVISPAEKDESMGVDPDRPETLNNVEMSLVMKWDLEMVLKVDAIVLLPGWEKSPGARLERVVAESTGKEVYLWSTGRLVLAAPWEHELIWKSGVRKTRIEA